MHKIIGAPIIEQLQIPSPPSFHSLRPPLDSFKSSLTRHVTELARFLVDVCQPPPPSFPSVIPIEQPRSKEYFFRQNRRTPVARSTKYSTSLPSASTRGRINRSARSPTEGIFIRLLVRGDLRALYELPWRPEPSICRPLKIQAERTRRRTLYFGTAWSWPRQTFGLKLGCEEGGGRGEAVRVKKNAESRCYGGWKGGRKKKDAHWQLGSEHVAVSQVKWCGLMQNWCKRHGGASRGVTQRLQVARLTWEWRVIFKWAIENTSKHVIQRYVRYTYSFSPWIIFFFSLRSLAWYDWFPTGGTGGFFPPFYFPSLWSLNLS